jgi:hypothetical protein
MMIGVGMIMVFWSLNEIWLSLQSARWPKTQGHVSSAFIGFHGKKPMACVTYEYHLKGQSYHGSTLYFGVNGQLSAQDNVPNVISQFPIGKAVQISYNPLNPSASCLQPGRLHWSTYLLTILGAGCIWAGVFVFNIRWMAIRKKSLKTEQLQPNRTSDDKSGAKTIV